MPICCIATVAARQHNHISLAQRTYNSHKNDARRWFQLPNIGIAPESCAMTAPERPKTCGECNYSTWANVGQDGDRWMVGACAVGEQLVAVALASTGAPCLPISMDSLRGLREHADSTGCKFGVKKVSGHEALLTRLKFKPHD